MRAVIAAIILFAFGVIGLQAITSHTIEHAVANRNLRQLANANDAYPAALAANQAAIAADLQAHPTQTIIEVPPWTNGSASASTVVNGDTLDDGTQLLAANVDTTAKERRIALTITVTSGNGHVSIRHYVILRAMSYAPYDELLSNLPLGAATDPTISTGTDTGGCSGAGLGCDPTALDPGSNSTLQATENCDQGVGSGTCPPSNYYNVTQTITNTWKSSQQ
ncbi:MAG: hypothetical protein ACYDHD_05590 [Vulcanimicrobiaceae bacterium]